MDMTTATSSKWLNALTVDVEDYFHVSAFADTINRSEWDDMTCRVERNTHRLLDIFSEKGVRSTFFVLGWVAERYPQLVRDIVSQGHELACHGYSHQLIYNQTEKEFREETLRSKALLEDQGQVRVLGYRAASYSITMQSLWALDVLVEAGFHYDSSIFPIHHDRYGIPGSSRWPHVLSAPGGGSLLEFPLSTAKRFGMSFPVSGGGYFRLYPYAVTRSGLKDINSRENMPFVFYLHPWELDTGQPRVAAKPLSRFRHYLNISKFEDRLSRLIDDFQFAPMRDVLDKLQLAGGISDVPHAVGQN